MKVLVTGAAGFIGSHIIERLLGAGADVLGLDSLDPGTWKQPPPYMRKDVEYVITDLRHVRWDERFADVEAIIHLAALGGVGRAEKEPANVLGANAGGTAQLIDLAYRMPNLQQVVLAASFSVYGSNYQYRVPSTGQVLDATRRTADLDAGNFEVCDPETGEVAELIAITEATPPAPLEIYGASKYMQELCFRGFTQAPMTALRFSSVYGTRMRLDDGEATIIAKLAGWVASGHAPSLFEDGRQIRDWVLVSDLADAAMAVVEGGSPWPIVNVCSGQPMTLLGACDILNDVTGQQVVANVVGGYRPGDMRHCLGDCSRFESLIGRKPKTFAEGAPLAFGELAGQ